MSEAQKVEFRFREKNGVKRETLELSVPLPTSQEIITILQGEDSKVKAAVVDSVVGLIITFLRGKVNENEEFSQEDVDNLVEKNELTLAYVSNLPRSERNTITNADLASFGQVFIQVAGELENDPARKIASAKGAQAAASIFADRLRSAAGKNDVLDKLQQMIEKFAEAASDEIISEQEAVIQWLYVKIEEAKKKDEVSLDNLD